MMDRLRSFFRTTILGGVAVILPIAIFLFVFRWLFGKVSSLIGPLTKLITSHTEVAQFIAELMVLLLLIGACFLVGLIVKTRLGLFIHKTLEERILKAFPGYSLIKETVLQFVGVKKFPFSDVALVRIFESETLATAFVTDEHENGMFTVFVPTGPNPTSGQIYHLSADRVHVVDVPVEETMRSIISCGAGSQEILAAHAARNAQETS